MGVGQPGPGPAIIWIGFSSPAEHQGCIFEVPAVVTGKVMPAAQEEIIGPGRNLMLFAQVIVLQRETQRIDDLVGNIFLNLEQVFSLAVVLASPEVKSIFSLDQLCRYTQMLAELPDASLEHGLNLELFGNLENIGMFSRKAKRGHPGGHSQTRNLAKGIEYFFCNTFTEIGLIAMLTHVIKWKHCHGRGGRNHRVS